MIREVVVTTVSAEGRPHVAPMGVRDEGGCTVLMPFRPSTTLDNVLATGCAVVNCTDDVRVFAGCVTGRRDWPTVPAEAVACVRLADCLAHEELELVRREEDPQRPRLVMRQVAARAHAPFRGMNRARAAVLEAAVLVSRLGMLPWDKVDSEIAYLGIAVEKTAGPEELEAWGWLMQRVADFRRQRAEAP